MNLFRFIKSVFFISTGIFLIWMTIQKIAFDDLKTALHQSLNWRLIPILLTSVMVVILRAKRWQLLLKTQEEAVSPFPLFHALNIGYLVNFAIPRLGEISRAFLLKNNQLIPFNKSIASIIFERLSDLIVLGFILISALVLEYFFNEGVVSHLIYSIQLNPFMLLIFSCFVAIIIGLMIQYWQKIKARIGIWAQEFIQYFSMLIRLKNRKKFILLTTGIWVGFYLMTMLWIFVFPVSTQLSFFACFEVMLVGVLARTLPIQAGSAGAYHFAVTSAFVYFGLPQNQALNMALMIHGFQSVLTIILGVFSYIWILYQQKNA